MRLVKFELLDGSPIYINPEAVQCVRPSSSDEYKGRGVRAIIISNDRYWYPVHENLDEVVLKLLGEWSGASRPRT